jgi:hypothetical protein
MAQEARGLDAGARLSGRLVGWGDNRTAAIVAAIAEEERAHVAVGVAWFGAVCGALGLDPGPEFRRLLLEVCPELLKGPHNHEERENVGLRREWYDVSRWPEEEEGMREAAEAAITARLGAEGGVAAPAVAPPMPDEELRRLRDRLGAVLAAEVAAAGDAESEEEAGVLSLRQ